MLDQIMTKLAEHGAMGLLAAGLFVALLRKDRELTLERAARIEDAKAYGQSALAVQKEQLDMVARFEASAKTQLEMRKGSYR